jgi:hypothetical protein
MRSQKSRSATTHQAPAPGEIVLLDSSSEDESEQGHQQSCEQLCAAQTLCIDDSRAEVQQNPRPALRRIQKRAPDSADAAADSLAGLSITQEEHGNDTLAAVVLPTPSPAIEPEASTSMDAGLVLGENREFQLAKVVSQLLYAHQVCTH